MTIPNVNRTPLQDEIIEQVRQFGAGLVLFNQRVAERVGLHPTDLQCVNLLDLLGRSTPGRLAEWMGLTTGGVTVMLDRLEKTGYIKREPNPADRRSVLVRVNAKKMAMIDAQYAGIARQFDEFISRVPETELQLAITFFRQLNAIRMNAAIGVEMQDQPA